ncbi:major facilitator superfamily domain-containing protein [Mycena floridula]|nr:major facilitator superfamily domain-containing protein [Mycena floridula]
MTGGGFTIIEAGTQNSNRFVGQSRIRGPTLFNFPLLTVSFLGVQIFWSVEMGYASPYLISLGLSKSMMAVVFLAGPLSGLLMQPLIGVLADQSTSRFGRRRPYMLGGTIVCLIAMLLFGWTRQVTGWLGFKSDTLVIWLAVIAIYVVDFSINAVQAVDRALLVDTLPSALQPSGNAWAACMLGIGSVVGFFVGNLDIPVIIPFLGRTQLQGLTVIGSLVLLLAHLVTAFSVTEKVMVKNVHETPAGGPLFKSFTSEVTEIFTNMWTLPRVIRQICIVQFFSWIAWFPILFYTTVYIGDLHKRAFYASLAATSKNTIALNIFNSTIPYRRAAIDTIALDAEATRFGSRALFYSSVLTLVGNTILPFFVAETAKRKQHASNNYSHNSLQSPFTPPKKKLLSFGIPNILRLHLCTLWTLGHAVLAGCMFATYFVKSVAGATGLITVTGISWAITQWAPFSLLAEAILTEPAQTDIGDGGSIRLTDTRRLSQARPRGISMTRVSQDTRRRSVASEESDDDLQEAVTAPLAPSPGKDSDEDSLSDVEERLNREARRKSFLLGNVGAGVSQTQISSNAYGPYDEDNEEAVLVGPDDYDSEDFDEQGKPNLSSKAGIILGIHNIFIVIPQFLITGLASLIFAIFDPQKSVIQTPPSGDSTITPLPDIPQQSDSVVYIFRVGGFSALIAFVLCFRLARELRHR